MSAAAVSDTMSDERHGPYEGLLDLLQRPSHALNDHEAEDTIHIDAFCTKWHFGCLARTLAPM